MDPERLEQLVARCEWQDDVIRDLRIELNQVKSELMRIRTTPEAEEERVTNLHQHLQEELKQVKEERDRLRDIHWGQAQIIQDLREMLVKPELLN